VHFVLSSSLKYIPHFSIPLKIMRSKVVVNDIEKGVVRLNRPKVIKCIRPRRSNRIPNSSSQDSIYLFDGDEHLCPLIQTRISLDDDDDDDDDKNESSYALDVVKPPSVDELYDWYRKYDGRDTEADPSWADIWPTEMELISKLVESKDLSRSFIEVGAGLSFAGLILAKHFRKKVMLLDREPLSLHCALSTAKVNGVEVVSCDMFEDAQDGSVAAAVFDWSKEVTRENLYLRNRVQIIIGADVLYDPDTCRDLAFACSILGEKVILCELRRERAIGLQSKFFDECKKLGATKCKIDEEMSNEEHVFLVVEF